MSPLWPRELRVGVFPDRVTLLPARRRLSWNGLSRVVDEPHGVSCDGATEESPWHAALQALEVALPEFSGHRTAATVILSNHFMRYTLLPWSDKLSSAEEELAFARHCFTRIYGPHAESWALRLSPESGTAPRLASAVDVELIDGLRGVFGAAGIPLKSIQPHLMAAYNSFRGGLGRHDAWLAVLEQGNLCLALLRRARWMRIRKLRIGGAAYAELPLILEREAYLADELEVPHEVYLWDPEAGGAALPDSPPWKFHPLCPASAPGGTAVDSPHLAIEGTG